MSILFSFSRRLCVVDFVRIYRVLFFPLTASVHLFYVFSNYIDVELKFVICPTPADIVRLYLNVEF